MRRKGLGAKQKWKTVLELHGNMTWVSGNAATELKRISDGKRRPSNARTYKAGLAHYFDTVFFNPALHDGEASRLMKQYGWNTIQTPRFYPMRESRPGTSIVRTFVQAAKSRP